MSDNGFEDGMDEVIAEFLVESHENLDQLDRDLVSLEQDPSNEDRLASIFRTIHTIKGTSGFLGFGQLESVSHVGESLLSLLRDRELVLNEDITSALLAMVDAVREMLSSIEASGGEGSRNDQSLIADLTRLQVQSSSGGSAHSAVPSVASMATTHVAPLDPAAPVAPVIDTAQPIGKLLVESTFAQEADVTKAVMAQEHGDPRHVGEILVDRGIIEPNDVVEALHTQAAGDAKSAVSDASIRVDVGLLDRLMNLVGELVLARNQILQHSGARADAGFLGTSQRLNLITTELQEGVMKTRMQPIGNVWAKFPRVVRDLALACGKSVRLELEGRETELDRTIIEAIKDPLTHLVRNAVDHGIESADNRVAKGKNPEGKVALRAYHEGGHVNIEIIDDGGGLDVERIRSKAVSKGLVRPEQLSTMSDKEVTNLIFLPGFSTAEKVTNVSGRGVGMDVVKTNIEKIGGTIDVATQLGHGTTFKMKIPLTLAIIPALIVTSGGQRYAIAQVSLLELVRLEPEAARTQVERVGAAPVYRLRGHLLPLVDLHEQLRGPDSTPPETEGAMTIVVLQADGKPFGLIVEGVSDTEEIVVKPLAKQLKGVQSYSGATIMGDGRVALILDVLGVAQQAGVLTGAAEPDVYTEELERQARDDRQTLLLLGLGGGCRAAVPLSLVDRLEEIPAGSVERAGDHEVVQYRGGIMPLIRLGEVLGASRDWNETANEVPLPVVVHRFGGRTVGLVVETILDIVEDTVKLDRSSAKHGVVGSAIIHDHVTDLVDVNSLIASCLSSFDSDLMEVAV